MAEGITAMTWLAVFMGGGVGSVLRFGLGKAFVPWRSAPFHGRFWRPTCWPRPCLAWCAVTGAELWGRTSPMWFFMTVGVCGGFSTFSTFAWDTLRLVARRWMGVGVDQCGRLRGGLRGGQLVGGPNHVLTPRALAVAEGTEATYLRAR